MKKIWNEDLIKIVISIAFFVTSIFIPEANTQIFFLGVSYAIISASIYINAFKHIKKKMFFDENVLMIIATLCAFAIGSFEEAVMVMLLFEIGEYLADLAVNRSKKSIKDLLDLRVEKANIIVNDEIVTVNIKKVTEGDILVVKPGEKIPLDGIVIEGTSSLNTSSLTGESIPRKVSKNDKVLSGCINKEKVLRIKATATYRNTTTTKIINLIETSNVKKAETEKFITKFSSIYTPVVVILAILLTLIPTILGYDFKDWLYRSLVFLVTSCPCALVISVPLAYFSGIGRASKEGILIKGSKELETLNDIDYIVLDKTGTITEGVFEVTKIYPVEMQSKKLLQIAASAEEFSIHPIAEAIKKKNKLPKLEAKYYKEISGKGISCRIEEQKVLIGNEKLLKDHNIITLPITELGTIIHIAINNEYAGYIVISDTIKKSASSLKKLVTDFNKQLIILSGDVEEVVKQVASRVGVKKYFAALLPQDKVTKVTEFQENGKVMFVGDGVNDAPVLHLADIGVSMGQVGSEAAIEASDIVIMKDDLKKLKTSLQIAKYTRTKIVQTLAFALTIKIIVLILGALGLSTVWMAVFADVGVTLLSVLNVLTIMWKKFK